MRRAAQQYGLREGGENDDWTLYWTDYSVSLERVMEMKSYQVSGPELVLSISRVLTVPQGYPTGTPVSPIAHEFRLSFAENQSLPRDE